MKQRTTPDAHEGFAGGPARGSATLAGLRRRLTPGLELNAFALMVTTGITAGFGLLFWAVATRYSAAEVGRASAVLTTASMMSVLSGLSVGLIFTRFLGSAGPKARRMVLGGYAAAATVAVVLGSGFVLFFRNDELFATGLDRLSFPFLVVVLALFALQDYVLIGLRASRWVPLEQFLFATAKLGLLALVSASLFHNGIVWAWGIPAAVAVLVVSPLLLLRVLPNMPPPSEGAIEMPSRRGMGVLFFAEYASGATTILVPMFLPLIVVAQLGTQANAYYALPWMISEALNLLLWNIYSSYMVEGSNDRRQLPGLMRRTFRLAWLVGGIATPVLLVAAPWMLSLLGGAYSAEGSDLLRLMALSLPFTIIYSMYISTSRVQQLMGRVVSLQVLSAVTTVGLALLLVGPLGINGVGIAYLASRVLGTAIVAVPLVRSLREPLPPEPAAAELDEGPAPEPAMGLAPEPDPELALALAPEPDQPDPVRGRS